MLPYTALLVLAISCIPGTALPTLAAQTAKPTSSSLQAANPPRGSVPRVARGQNGNGNPPPYKPVVTPAPDQAAELARQGYSQETFYACKTLADGEEHCGWHVPVVKVAATGARTDMGVVGLAVACLAGVFALGLV